jgi:hypothetical protein
MQTSIHLDLIRFFLKKFGFTHNQVLYLLHWTAHHFLYPILFVLEALDLQILSQTEESAFE